MGIPLRRYVEKLPLSFPRHLLLAGRWTGDTLPIYDVVWCYPDILEVLAALDEEFYVCFGGDVYGEEGGLLLPNGDTWGCKADPAWTWIEYTHRSYEVGRDYIEMYHRRNGDGFWYAPSFGYEMPRRADSSETEVKIADRRLILRTDGASRGNPGHAAAGIVIERADGEPLAQDRRYLGVLTNNQAEYQALILGLKLVARYAPTVVTVCMDSELVVRQMAGAYKVKDATLLTLHEEAKALVAALPKVTFTHVPRSQNAQADRLANE